jgi:hypothetical protein
MTTTMNTRRAAPADDVKEPAPAPGAAYLTIVRFSGDPNRLLDEYRKHSEVMSAVGRDHRLILHGRRQDRQRFPGRQPLAIALGFRGGCPRSTPARRPRKDGDQAGPDPPRAPPGGELRRAPIVRGGRCPAPIRRDLLRIRDGVYAPDLLTVAVVELGLFDWTESNGPCSQTRLGDGLGLALRLCDVLVT